MPQTYFNSNIKDLEFLIAQNDFNQASRRILDFSFEFDLNFEAVELAYSIRNKYQAYQQNDVITQEHRDEIYKDCTQFCNLLRQQEAEIVNKLASLLKPNLPVYEATGLSKRFHSGNSPFYLKPLNLTLNLGELTGVVGENGNGKTTLLRIVAGELMSDTGVIKYPCLNTREDDWYAVKNKIAFIPQRLSKWHGTLNDNLKFFANIHNLKGEENTRYVEYILNRLGLVKYRHLKWSEISSGYRLRFELAKVLMWRPKLLVLDEPLANLDINAQQLFLQDLKQIAKSVKFPISIIFSSQALHEVESVANNIVFIKQGNVLYSGSRKEFGETRATNTFEVSGNFNLAQLIEIMQKVEGTKVEQNGTVCIVHTPTNFDVKQFLLLLLESNIKLNYFRDISTSTRKLFQKDF